MNGALLEGPPGNNTGRRSGRIPQLALGSIAPPNPSRRVAILRWLVADRCRNARNSSRPGTRHGGSSQPQEEWADDLRAPSAQVDATADLRHREGAEPGYGAVVKGLKVRPRGWANAASIFLRGVQFPVRMSPKRSAWQVIGREVLDLGVRPVRWTRSGSHTKRPRGLQRRIASVVGKAHRRLQSAPSGIPSRRLNHGSRPRICRDAVAIRSGMRACWADRASPEMAQALVRVGKVIQAIDRSREICEMWPSAEEKLVTAGPRSKPPSQSERSRARFSCLYQSMVPQEPPTADRWDRR